MNVQIDGIPLNQLFQSVEDGVFQPLSHPRTTKITFFGKTFFDHGQPVSANIEFIFEDNGKVDIRIIHNDEVIESTQETLNDIMEICRRR